MKTIKNWKSFLESVDVVPTATKLNVKDKKAEKQIIEDYKKVAGSVKTCETQAQIDACEKLIHNFFNKYKNVNNKDWVSQRHVEMSTDYVNRANELMKELKKKEKSLKETKKIKQYR